MKDWISSTLVSKHRWFQAWAYPGNAQVSYQRSTLNSFTEETDLLNVQYASGRVKQ